LAMRLSISGKDAILPETMRCVVGCGYFSTA